MKNKYIKIYPSPRPSVIYPFAYDYICKIYTHYIKRKKKEKKSKIHLGLFSVSNTGKSLF